MRQLPMVLLLAACGSSAMNVDDAADLSMVDLASVDLASEVDLSSEADLAADVDLAPNVDLAPQVDFTFLPRTDGTSCTLDEQCQNSHCVDGVCCASACGGCNACNVPGKEGTCSEVPAGEDPHHFCAAACADHCDGVGACRTAIAGTVCQADGCHNSISGSAQWDASFSGRHVCDGSSTSCPGSTSEECANHFICDTGSGLCKTSCVTDRDCTSGHFCQSGTCVDTLSPCQSASCGPSLACSRELQCSNFPITACANGFCRNCAAVGGDCILNQVCEPTTGTCWNCDATHSCAGSGLGDSCVSGRCSCSSASECGTFGPLCSNGHCVCNTTNGTYCFASTEVCVTPGPSGQCRLSTGRPCISGSACASGVCTNNVCAF